METTIFSSKPAFLRARGNNNTPLPSRLIQLHHRHLIPHSPELSRAMRLTARRDIHDGDFNGAIVDSDMFMLRRRIHETEISEAKLEAQKFWMEWEREYYDKYCSSVCAFTGLVHLLLVNSRPSVAIAMLVLLTSSVPASMIMLLLHLGGFCH